MTPEHRNALVLMIAKLHPAAAEPIVAALAEIDQLESDLTALREQMEKGVEIDLSPHQTMTGWISINGGEGIIYRKLSRKFPRISPEHSCDGLGDGESRRARIILEEGETNEI